MGNRREIFAGRRQRLRSASMLPTVFCRVFNHAERYAEGSKACWLALLSTLFNAPICTGILAKRDASTACGCASSHLIAHLPREKVFKSLQESLHCVPGSRAAHRGTTCGTQTWLQSRCAAAQEARKHASHQADAALQLVRQRWLDAQIEEG
eukprot:125134-Chlamydomonas_euryale.AAC.4